MKFTTLNINIKEEELSKMNEHSSFLGKFIKKSKLISKQRKTKASKNWLRDNIATDSTHIKDRIRTYYELFAYKLDNLNEKYKFIERKTIKDNLKRNK